MIRETNPQSDCGQGVSTSHYVVALFLCARLRLLFPIHIKDVDSATTVGHYGGVVRFLDVHRFLCQNQRRDSIRTAEITLREIVITGSVYLDIAVVITVVCALIAVIARDVGKK